jgi:hypothetical protein
MEDLLITIPHFYPSSSKVLQKPMLKPRTVYQYHLTGSCRWVSNSITDTVAWWQYSAFPLLVLPDGDSRPRWSGAHLGRSWRHLAELPAETVSFFTSPGGKGYF